MNKGKLNKVIEDGNIVIPVYILKNFKKLNLTMEEFVFLMYLYNKQDKIDFNPEKMALDLNIDIMEVMGYVSVLTDKGYLALDVIKTENNILEEVINLSNFYEKISLLIINNQETEDDNYLFKYIERELGRPLSTMEMDLISKWLKNGISEELIKEAVNMALNDGVYSLKYIDKILFDWKSRGYTRVEDIKVKEAKTKENDEIELDDWNWLDDEEEYITN